MHKPYHFLGMMGKRRNASNASSGVAKTGCTGCPTMSVLFFIVCVGIKLTLLTNEVVSGLQLQDSVVPYSSALLVHMHLPEQVRVCVCGLIRCLFV